MDFNKAMIVYVMVLLNISCSALESLIPRISYTDSQHWVLPYGAFTVFNATYSPNFESAFLYQVGAITFIGIGLSSVSTCIAGVMAYISYQCKILQNFIGMSVAYSNTKMLQCEHGTLDATYSDPSKIEWKYFQETIKEIVEYHTAILDLAENFNELLNVLALLDFLGMSFVICTALFAASVYSTFNLALVDLLLLAAGNTFLQFIISYWGNQVITESEAVARSCYEVNFIGADIRFQKSWIDIIRRSQRPIYFTVGKFAPLSLNTFQKVIQTAYSYLMMLHHFNEERAIAV